MDESDRWDAAYLRESGPPWDIQRPQPAIRRLAEDGRLHGDVLDSGCGTGEHALLAAAGGANVLGVDLSNIAIERARRKASERGIHARFEAADVLTMPLPEAAFDVVIDSGVFHSFDDDARQRYLTRLRSAIRPGGHYFLLCFSELQPGDWGPRRVHGDELVTAFADGWVVRRMERSVFEINPLPEATEVQAWFVEAQAH